MKIILRRIKNVLNDRCTRVLFYDQTFKKGYASLASFPKIFVVRRVFITIIAYPISLICWIFLIILNRFKRVRIYRFRRPSRPGFASVYIEQLELLCRELQASGHKGFLIFIDASQTTNLELLKLYASHFNLYLDDRVAFVRTVFALIPKFGFSNSFVKHSYYDANWELAPAINLNVKRKIEIPVRISQLGLEPFKFVILSHRSVSYDRKYHKNTQSDFDRYSDLGKAADAIKLIHEKDLKTVRIGVKTDELPNSLSHLPIIDLSGEFRTNTQDLWLAKNCLFLWCLNDNGTWHFAHKYNRPTLVTNTNALIRGFQHSLFTFKLMWDEVNNGYVSLHERVLLRGVNGRISEMKKRGLSYVENSPSELVAAVSEMFSHLDSKTDHTESDQTLLSKFSETLVSAGYPPRHKHHSQPCISFLRAHHNLLD